MSEKKEYVPVHSTGGTPSAPPASTERARPNNANAANTVVATERLLPWSAFTFASASWREVMADFFCFSIQVFF